jgi:sugar lactone lactonase YvrE
MCVLGPLIDIDDDKENLSVVGGVLVPLSAEVEAEEFTWSQVSGPPVEILGAETLQVAVVVPADAPPGDTVTLRLSATRNGVTLDADATIGILDAVFENALPGISDSAQLGTTEGLAFGPTGMWVVSTEGFVSRFAPDGAFIERYDVPGAPVGADYFEENLFVANRDGTGRIELLSTVSGNLSTLLDALEGGGPLGEVNLPLVDRIDDGIYDLYVSTRLGQTVLRYSSETGVANVFLEDMSVVNPNALTFGPEGNAIYVGAQGHVWRVPLTDGGVAGTPEDYLVLGDDTDITYEVDGLAFDEGGNLWVGCPNASTLFVSHYAVTAPAEISRTFEAVGGGVSGFVNLAFGRDDFQDDTLYYTNLADGTVGRLRVGLQAL